jgi:hypothetical protein
MKPVGQKHVTVEGAKVEGPSLIFLSDRRWIKMLFSSKIGFNSRSLPL